MKEVTVRVYEGRWMDTAGEETNTLQLNCHQRQDRRRIQSNLIAPRYGGSPFGVESTSLGIHNCNRIRCVMAITVIMQLCGWQL